VKSERRFIVLRLAENPNRTEVLAAFETDVEVLPRDGKHWWMHPRGGGARLIGTHVPFPVDRERHFILGVYDRTNDRQLTQMVHDAAQALLRPGGDEN